ncbi:M56 family metallopeptidase [Salegentibacter sp. F14]
MVQYLLQVILFQLAFLLGYEVLFKKETFFNANRAYLLLSPVLALFLPFLKIEGLEQLFPVETIQGMTLIDLPEVFIGNQPSAKGGLPEVLLQDKSFQINWYLVVYFGGVFMSTLLFFKKYQSLNRLFRFKRISVEKTFRIIEIPNSKIACTFYKTIFLGDGLPKEDREQILSHEIVHVKQKHSLDLVFFELLKIIFWYNPLIYIFQHRIAALHEFIADASVVKTVQRRNYYEQLLNTAFNSQNISFINQFFKHSLIKKRIIMLQKSRSKSIAKFKFLLIVPLLLIMLTYVACSDNSQVIGREQSIAEQLADIQKALDQGQELNEEEVRQLAEIMATAKGYVPSSSTTSEKVGYSSGKDVPFAVIDEVPVFPGCESLTDQEERKKCMSSGIADFVNSNFKVKEMREFAEIGLNRVIVQFKIDDAGRIAEAKARAKSPELEAEALRVINALPQMQPGKQQGKEVGVMYSLPIVFQVEE